MPEQRTVVIVEDDYLIAMEIRAMCEECHHTVLAVANSAENAKRKLEQQCPDVLITDMELGRGGDGVDVVEAMRLVHPQVRVIFATGATTPDMLARIDSSRPDKVLTKPVSIRELRNALAGASEPAPAVRV